MNRTTKLALASVSVLAISHPAHAQDSEVAADDNKDVIIVTARRREESLQDVPLSVNALSGELLDDLQVRDFEEIENLVPGLDFTPQSQVGYATTLRGVRVDITVSGQSQTVEVYKNDVLTQSNSVLQANYDIGGIEVLRGPQGTLRGRASPSGAITYHTRLPDLNEVGGYVDTTHTNIGGHNFNGAVSVPIIEDRFAIRLAGLWDTDNDTRVRSLNSAIAPNNTTHSYRITGLLKPADNLEIRIINERLFRERQGFTGVQSASIPLPTAAPGDPAFTHTMSTSALRYIPIAEHAGFITVADHIGLSDFPDFADEDFRTTSWQLDWEIGGQRLVYVGGDYHQNQFTGGGIGTSGEIDSTNLDPANLFDLFGSDLPAECPVLGSTPPTVTPGTGCFHGRGVGLTVENFNRSHEVRIQSAEPLFGRLDYTIGAFFLRTMGPVDNTQRTFVALDGGGAVPMFDPAGFNALVLTQIDRQSNSEEYSFFGHLAYHLGNNTEIAAGARRIHFEANSTLGIGGTLNTFGTDDTDGVPFDPVSGRQASPPCDCENWIWTASLKHRFTPSFMGYVNVGTGWRYTQLKVGDFSIIKSPRQFAASQLPPETSRSYEAGFKSEWFDGRLTLNAAGFYQEFKNSPFISGPVWIVRTLDTDPPGGVVARQAGFLNAVPIDVWGGEFEFNAQPTDRWNIAGNFAWAKGSISSGEIFCDDFFINADGPGVTPGSDSIQDELASTNPPIDVDVIRAATGGENLAVCDITDPIRAFDTPLWQSSVNSTYRHPLTSSLEGYLRGQITIYGKSQGKLNNDLDDRGQYQTVNLYAGIENVDSGWELSLFVRNVFKEQFTRYTTVNGVPGGLLATNYRGPAPTALESEYRGVNLGAPREIGVNLRYRFGPG